VTCKDIEWIYEKDKWEELKSIGMVKTTIKKDGEEKAEFFAISLTFYQLSFSFMCFACCTPP
jgi:hypothetical protein